MKIEEIKPGQRFYIEYGDRAYKIKCINIDIQEGLIYWKFDYLIPWFDPDRYVSKFTEYYFKNLNLINPKI